MGIRGIANSLVAGLVSIVSLLSASPANAATLIDTTVLPFDVSHPQCGNLPVLTATVPAIVGVNQGLPMTSNPCLAEQLVWAGGAAAAFYINTANPGPTLSKFWPLGQQTPQVCDETVSDSLGCAYDYGYNFAENSYVSLAAAFTANGLALNPTTTTIWLDVETSNSWVADTTKNVTVLQGAIDNLRLAHGFTSLGIYSTTAQWLQITGASQKFADLPFWGAGAASPLTATDICARKIGPTGGQIQLVQFIQNGFDQNLICASAAKITAAVTAKVPSVLKRGKLVTIKAKVLSETGAALVGSKVTLALGKKKFSATTDQTGLAKIKVVAPTKAGLSLVTISAAGGKFYSVASFVSSAQIK